ncbi:MAG: FG-GAP-like repeat-containing protein, partial [Acidobacteria bacterium]|nr:FG-GAP-like repeat-containing protein [Acidobacteriota bacterium]
MKNMIARPARPSSRARRQALLLSLFVLCGWGAQTARAAGECSTASFKIAKRFPAGVFVRSLAVGDFNRDGRPDVASASLQAAEVVVMFGAGADGFGPPHRFPTGGRPGDVAAGDFNGDGKPDLIAASYDPAGLSVLFGDGAGAFAPPVNAAIAGVRANLVAPGDFNGDGKLDAAVAVAEELWVMLGDGAGGFAPSPGARFTLGRHLGSLGAVVVADFNLDGRLDIVATGDGVSVLLGDGAGNFAAPFRMLRDAAAAGATVADFNGDGKPDLAVADATFNSFGVSVFPGNGDGTFAPPLKRATPNPPRGGIVAGDFNGDGKADVAAATGLQGVTVLTGDGAGNLSVVRPTFSAAGVTEEIAAADFDGDGKLDLAAAAGNSVALLYGEGGGALAAAGHVDAGTRPGPTVVADFNNDGKRDLAVVNNWLSPDQTFARVSIFLGDGAGGLARASTLNFGFPIILYALAAADFNTDSKIDLAITERRNGSVLIYLGNGDGTFAPGTHTAAFGSQPTYVKAADFNNDGRADLAVAYTNTRNFAVLLGDGAGGFTRSSGFSLFANSVSEDFAVGDLNNDGKLDLVFAGYHARSIVALLGNGAGQFSLLPGVAANNGPLSVAVHDFTGDGKADVVYGNGLANTVSLLPGDGAGGFGPAVEYAVGSYPAALVAADFNGDGRGDLAVGNGTSGTVSVLTGNGAGGFGASLTYDFGSYTSSVAAGDFGGDARPDLAVANLGGDSLTLLINNSATAPPVPCVSVADVTVAEGDAGTRDATFTVTLSEASAQTVRVNYHFTNGFGGTFEGGAFIQFGAVNGQDYNGVAGTLEFAPGQTTRTVTAAVIGDLSDEYDEPFDLNLSAASGASITRARAVAVITDDDAPPAMTISDASAAEGNSTFNPNAAAFNVSLSAPSAKGITVQYVNAPGTATAITDYQVLGPILIVFAPGEAAKTINIPINGDTAHEPDETFFVGLSGVTNATLARAEGQGTILNDDPQPTVSADSASATEGDAGTSNAIVNVRLSHVTYQTVTVSYATADGTAAAGSDYVAASGTLTFAPGETTKQITVLVNGDTVDEQTETFNVNLSAPGNAALGAAQAVVSISDDDGPTVSVGDVSVAEGNPGALVNAAFTFTLSAASVQPVVVRYSTNSGQGPGSALGGVDYQQRFNVQVTIPAGSLSATSNVRVLSDYAVEPDETFFVNLLQPLNATIGDGQGVATITNDDAPGALQFAAESVSVNEEAGAAVVTVTRSGGAGGAVAVTYATSDGTAAAAAGDYAATTGTLNFVEGELSKTISVPVNDDALAEGTETFTVTLNAASGGASLGARTSASISVLDNDDSHVAFAAASFAAGESDARAAISVTRTGSTANAVTVQLRTADDPAAVPCSTTNGTAYARCDYATTVETVSFAAGEAGPKIIDVPLIDDSHVEGAETLGLRLSAPVGTSLGAQDAATLTISDNDSPGAANPIDGNAFFVRQHYLDFLSREPEAGEPWTGVL